MTPRLVAALAALAGLALFALGWSVDPARAAYSWLVAALFAYGLACAALLLASIAHLTDAVWLAALRRPVEAIVATLPLVALLVVPVLALHHTIYPWAGGGLPLSEEAEELVRQKRAWLDGPFFLARSGIYLLVPALMGELLLRWSGRRDRRRLRVAAAVGIPLLGLVITFAMFDWLMSLEPSFYSTSFGLVPNAGAFAALLGLLAVVVAIAGERGERTAVTREHLHALGKLALTAVCLWAYLAFTQYFVVWLPDLPVEVRWYLPRTDSWGAVAIALALLHFAVPFAALLSRALKRRRAPLAAVGALLVAMHWVDLWWHAVPALRPSGPDLSIADLGAVLVVSGACALLAMLRSRRARPLSARVRGYRSEWGLDGEPAARAVARRPARARSEAPPELRQSPEGLHARGIAVVVAVSTAVLALALAVALWMSAAREGTAHAPDVTPRGAIAAVERGAFEGPARGLLLRAEDEARLHRYGWADRRRGLAQVPIARALELAAAGCRPPGAGASAFRLEDAPSPCELGAAREAP